MKRSRHGVGTTYLECGYTSTSRTDIAVVPRFFFVSNVAEGTGQQTNQYERQRLFKQVKANRQPYKKQGNRMP